MYVCIRYNTLAQLSHLEVVHNCLSGAPFSLAMCSQSSSYSVSMFWLNGACVSIALFFKFLSAEILN